MITSKTPSFQTFNIEGVEHISPENAYSEVQEGTAIIVDVREETEYRNEFIPLNDVYHFPMSVIMENLQNIPNDKPIIIVCRGGVRSIKVANMLNRNGFVNVVNLDGGLIMWKAKGLPLDNNIPINFGCGCSCSR